MNEWLYREDFHVHELQLVKHCYSPCLVRFANVLVLSPIFNSWIEVIGSTSLTADDCAFPVPKANASPIKLSNQRRKRRALYSQHY